MVASPLFVHGIGMPSVVAKISVRIKICHENFADDRI
jgi:hypothetical protein